MHRNKDFPWSVPSVGVNIFFYYKFKRYTQTVEMEDSSRTVFLKKGKEKGSLAEEAESWRSPLRQDCSDYGRGLSNKAEMGSHRKISQASYGSSPRKDGHGILSNSSVGFKKRGQSPGGRQHDDGFRKFPAQDDHHTREENWRERSNSHEFTRERKDSMQGASEDLSRRADDGRKGNMLGMRMSVVYKCSFLQRQNKTMVGVSGTTLYDKTGLINKEICKNTHFMFCQKKMLCKVLNVFVKYLLSL